ncbi:MAG: cyclic nucleotide-binding domain-containing protein [Rhodospirillales bacterium]|jgi:CRP-like cAMP-binding protein|nr:cyclic nucleotide-binding domain-containing protein [Rhodospirillales bacterium]
MISTRRYIVSRRLGDFFGEMALVDDAPRSASAVAREDALCAQFSKEVIDEAMARSGFLIAALIRLLAKRLRKATAGPD